MLATIGFWGGGLNVNSSIGGMGAGVLCGALILAPLDGWTSLFVVLELFLQLT